MRILLLLCLLPLPALGQVTTNDQALDALKPKAPAAAQAAGESDVLTPADTPKRPVVHHTVHHTPTTTTAHTAHAAKPAAPPSVPLAPPANPVLLPPPQVLPVHKRPDPPPVPIKADAAGAPSFIPGGIRLTFGPGIADLNEANDEALLDIAARAKADPALTISIVAWAPGTNEDPSTPRRLSLDRALAARAVLINAGIISDRVLAQARGFLNIEGGPPDRVDITLVHPKSTPAGSPAPASAATPPAAAKPPP